MAVKIEPSAGPSGFLARHLCGKDPPPSTSGFRYGPATLRIYAVAHVEVARRRPAV